MRWWEWDLEQPVGKEFSLNIIFSPSEKIKQYKGFFSSSILWHFLTFPSIHTLSLPYHCTTSQRDPIVYIFNWQFISVTVKNLYTFFIFFISAINLADAQPDDLLDISLLITVSTVIFLLAVFHNSSIFSWDITNTWGTECILAFSMPSIFLCITRKSRKSDTCAAVEEIYSSWNSMS